MGPCPRMSHSRCLTVKEREEKTIGENMRKSKLVKRPSGETHWDSGNSFIKEYSCECELITYSSRDRIPNAHLCRSHRWWHTKGGHLHARCSYSCETTGRHTGRAGNRAGRESSPGLYRSLESNHGRVFKYFACVVWSYGGELCWTEMPYKFSQELV